MQIYGHRKWRCLHVAVENYVILAFHLQLQNHFTILVPDIFCLLLSLLFFLLFPPTQPTWRDSRQIVWFFYTPSACIYITFSRSLSLSLCLPCFLRCFHPRMKVYSNILFACSAPIFILPVFLTMNNIFEEFSRPFVAIATEKPYFPMG